MIRTFKDKRTSAVHEGEFVKGLDGKIQQRAREKLKYLGAAHDRRDLMIPAIKPAGDAERRPPGAVQHPHQPTVADLLPVGRSRCV